jgi:hypothetical protein
VNRDDHRNEDHLEVVKVPLSVLRPFLKIKMVSAAGSDPCRPKSGGGHIPTVALDYGEP